MENTKEIERKFLVNSLPDLTGTKYRHIEQAYLCTSPVVRIRKEDDDYYMTYKSEGFLEREEYNLPLYKDSYLHLLSKADGNIITKKRYLLDYQTHTIELDVFEGIFKGLMIAEVEFKNQTEAKAFVPPSWFGKEVTYEGRYHNSYLSSAAISIVQKEIIPCLPESRCLV